MQRKQERKGSVHYLQYIEVRKCEPLQVRSGTVLVSKHTPKAKNALGPKGIRKTLKLKNVENKHKNKKIVLEKTVLNVFRLRLLVFHYHTH